MDMKEIHIKELGFEGRHNSLCGLKGLDRDKCVGPGWETCIDCRTIYRAQQSAKRWDGKPRRRQHVD